MSSLFSHDAIERRLLKQDEKDAVSLALGREIDEERICFASNAYSAWSTRQIEDELRRLSSLVLADHQVRGMAAKLEGLHIAMTVRRAREGRTDPISST